MPESAGAETLVPPTTAQPNGFFDPWNVLPSNTHTPVLALASKEKSGAPRDSPTIRAMPFGNPGRGSNKLGPPPVSCQAFSSKNLPVFESREIVVPPAQS